MRWEKQTKAEWSILQLHRSLLGTEVFTEGFLQSRAQKWGDEKLSFCAPGCSLEPCCCLPHEPRKPGALLGGRAVLGGEKWELKGARQGEVDPSCCLKHLWVFFLFLFSGR